MPNKELIPRIIHYCWFGGGKKPPIFHKCLESWHRFLPNYQIVEWNETNSPMDEPYISAMRKRRQYVSVSNFIRLYALECSGGIYLDTDIEVLQDFAPLLENGCFLGFQQKEREHNGHWLNHAVLGARPNHPLVKKALVEFRNQATEDYFQDAGTSGPQFITRMLIESGLDHYGKQKINDVTLYPAEYFYPYPWWAAFHPARITENTYTIHHWQMSWVENDPRPRRLRQKAAVYNATSKLLGLAQPVPSLYKAIVHASSWYS